MAVIQGIQGSGNFVTDGRPKNWREGILYRFPNGAPIVAFTSKLPKEPTDDGEYNWWEKTLPAQRSIINDSGIGAADSPAGTVTLITIDDGAGASGEADKFIKGTVVLNETTNEIMVVTADPTNATQITVARARGGTAASALANNHALSIIGNTYEEGALTPRSRYTQPSKINNFTQIFRTSLAMTRSARKTRLRYDRGGISADAIREALQYHAIEMEKAFIFGGKEEITGPDGMPERLTGGIKSFITTNVKDFAGTVTESTWETELEKLFRFGSQSKLALAGTQALLTLNTLSKASGTINLQPTSEIYGMRLNEYVTPFGTLMIAAHPLFTGHAVWGKNMLVVDLANIRYRYIDDTVLLPHRQERGRDGRIDEFLTEAGLEVWHETTHAYYSDMGATA